MIAFNDLVTLARTIGPATPSTSLFWTDPHIAPALLASHLDPNTDAASRRPKAIDATIAWLETVALQGPSRILDLGCGPGLYSERLARRGHQLTGIDISELSINHARERARAEGLDIRYRQADYIVDNIGFGYDLVLMIYCDLGALSGENRETVMKKVRASLNPGGIFVFDLLSESCASQFTASKNWSLEQAGFWSPRPHLLLEENHHYPELKMFQRATLLAEAETGRFERFIIRDWYFSDDDIRALAARAGFDDCALYRGFLPNANWGNANVVFAAAK